MTMTETESITGMTMMMMATELPMMMTMIMKREIMMMNATKRIWRKWIQSTPGLGPWLKIVVKLMDIWTLENVKERIERYFNRYDQMKEDNSVQGNGVRLINLKVCHDHKSDEDIHHPANKILKVAK